MKLHLDTAREFNLISGHGPGYILVNGQRHERNLLVLPDEVFTHWSAHKHFITLGPEDFDAVLARDPEIVLLGTGQEQRFPHPSLYQRLLAARIGVEIMSTPAACRTYNILAGEGRRVAAALLLDTP